MKMQMQPRRPMASVDVLEHLDEHLKQSLMARPSPRDEQRLARVLDAATDVRIESLEADKQPHVSRLREVLAQPNVVGVGIAEKISGNQQVGRLALTVYVEKKVPLQKLRPADVVPESLDSSLAGETLLTDVVAIGRLRLQSPFVQREPIQPGNSIGHLRTAGGTLGAIVRHGKARLFLSNSHVLALSGKAKKGDRILYPGKFDKGKVPKDVIALLSDHVPLRPGGQFVNRVDGAIARLDKSCTRALEAGLRGCQAPKGITAAKRGMKIQIAGRSSGVAHGTILDVHFRFTVDYPGLGTVGFRDQIRCSRYSKSGDSGALVVETASGKAVGLHFAGGAMGSVCNPIHAVLEELDVKLECIR